MDIQEFESQIRIGDRVKIQNGHGFAKIKKRTSPAYIFMGYKPCTRCMKWRDCPGYVRLEKENDRSIEETTCYRQRGDGKNNIRLIILKHQNNLPEDLFEI